MAALAEAVNSLVAEPATAERMGVAGRRWAVEEFFWPSVAERIVALYRSLTGGVLIRFAIATPGVQRLPARCAAGSAFGRW